MTTSRDIIQTSIGQLASDGDGVRLTRMVGSPDVNMVDPFLLLDAFGSDQPGDYIGGFPSHPHRGFETVTYLLAGRMRHKDSAGHEGVIEPGGVQWMTAGRGVIHSEMPEQENGLLAGFQLWVNLPASHKMTDPAYQEFPASEIPVEQLVSGGSVKVIAGQTDQGTMGPAHIATTMPLFFDVSLPSNTPFRQAVPFSYGGFLYVLEGSIHGGGDVSAKMVGVLGDGDHIDVVAGPEGARFLLIAGIQLNEPVARGGPFVMNTKSEILQAFEDYQQGRF